jgi:hypothetical protein
MTEFEEDVREEVLALFPEIDPQSYEGYGPVGATVAEGA